VRAALRPAARRLAGPFVRTASFAAARRSPGLRLIAARCACEASAGRDAEDLGSRRSARRTARDRLADGRLRLRPLATSRAAFRAVCFDVLPALGAGSFTPARRAFDSPMAIACLGDRAPCFPSRMWWISSRTNSPACVDLDFPCAASFRARSMVSFSGMDLTSAGKVRIQSSRSIPSG